MAVRDQFPEAGSQEHGGTSDGYVFQVIFTGRKLKDVYEMVRIFLIEEGYADVPIPKDAEELRLFRQSRNKQPQLFEMNGYVHNPIKILFLPSQGRRITLGLFLYNEQMADHLIRFHGVGKMK